MPFLPLLKKNNAVLIELPTVVDFCFAGMSIKITTVMPLAICEITSSISFQTISFKNAVTRYYLKVTGENDGLDDVTIPMTSFQARRRSGESSYLSVVIPTTDFIDDIDDRSNGEMVVMQGYVVDGTIKQIEEILRTDIETVRADIGTKSQSISLTGYKQKTFSPQTIPMENLTYKSVSNGKRRFRLAKPYIFLNPGDTVQIDGETDMIVDVMSYAIAPHSQQIEIEEA